MPSFRKCSLPPPGREKSRTYWKRPWETARSGVCKIQSGWARYRSESLFTISGSNQSPNFRPRAVTFSAIPVMPSGKREGAATQSPRPARSFRLAPNHPSSRTNNSTPHVFCFRGNLYQPVFCKIKISGLPVVEKDGTGSVPPVASGQPVPIQPVKCLA